MGLIRPALNGLAALALSAWGHCGAASLNPEAVRVREIRKDEISQPIERADVQTVVLMPPACLSSDRGNAATVARWYCGAWAAIARQPGAGIELAPDTGEGDSVGKQVALANAPGKRYVLLLDWTTALREAGGSWYFISFASEEVLFDRQSQRWLWHAVRRFERYTQANTPNEEVKADLKSHIDKRVIADILNRPSALRPSERYAMTWVASDNRSGPPAAEKARVIVFNDYFQAGKTHEDSAAELQLLRADDDTDNKSRYAAPAVRLQLGWRSYAAFDVAPGKYAIHFAVDGRQDLDLRAGDVRHLRYYRGLLNARSVEEISADKANGLFESAKNAMLVDTFAPMSARSHSNVRFMQP